MRLYFAVFNQFGSCLCSQIYHVPIENLLPYRKTTDVEFHLQYVPILYPESSLCPFVSQVQSAPLHGGCADLRQHQYQIV